MIQAHATTLIDRPIASIFQYIAADFFKNYPKWSPEVVELEALTPGPLRLGTQARQVRVDWGHQTESTFQVVAYQPPRRICFESTSSPYYRVRYDFEPINDCTWLVFVFEVKLEFFLRPFEAIITNSIRAGSERVVHNLKQLLEAETQLEQSVFSVETGSSIGSSEIGTRPMGMPHKRASSLKTIVSGKAPPPFLRT